MPISPMNKMLVVLFTCFISSCNNKDLKSVDLVSNITDTLEYSQKGFNDGILLSLIDNKTFEYEKYSYGCIGGSHVEKMYGYYEKESDYLKLFPERVKIETKYIDFDMDNIIIESNYVPDSFSIKTDYYIVDWGNNEYLLSEDSSLVGDEQINDFHRFSEYFNSGSEPENSGRYLVNKSNDSDFENEDLNISTIPIKWRYLFLIQPIKSFVKDFRISTVHRDDDHPQKLDIEINKGSLNQVRKGMTFTNEDGKFSMKIDSVREHSSFGIGYIYDFENGRDIVIGSELRTKWK